MKDEMIKKIEANPRNVCIELLWFDFDDIFVHCFHIELMKHTGNIAPKQRDTFSLAFLFWHIYLQFTEEISVCFVCVSRSVAILEETE